MIDPPQNSYHFNGGNVNSVNEKQSKPLFEPIKIGHLKVKNRVAFAPTGMGTAGPNGSITDQTICHYVARAKGGAGLIIIEHSLCSLEHWKLDVPILSFHSSSSMVWMKDLADAIHHFGAKSVVQLSLGLGRQSSMRAAGTELAAPSALPYFVSEGSTPRALRYLEGSRGDVPRELKAEEILVLERNFLRAAMRIKKAGFDGIEIHGAHGYLLADFISPLINRRTDSYGGSIEKRLSLPLRLIKKMREKAGKKFVIGFRISGDEHTEGGLTLEDTLNVVRELANAGLDYIHLSSGRQEALKHLFPEKEGIILPEAEAVKKAVDIPVICPNIHDPALAEKITGENRVDMVSLSRGLLADPEWPNKTREGRVEEIRRCVFCYHCIKSLWDGLGTRCSVNPDVGRERFIAEYQPFEKLNGPR